MIYLLPMSDLSRNDVLKLAELARLELTDEEIEQYRNELSEILQYVELLHAVDVQGLKPTNQVTGLTNVTRKDEIVDYGYAPKELLRNVPQVQADNIKVNRMIEQ
jgi:aspartyl-tRNA(Asn)/glutamyl-tRNA(Gln) amidotransferase subunit C